MSDKVKVDVLPIPDGKFSGGAGVEAREPLEMSDILNALGKDAGLVQMTDAATIAVAGADTPTIEIAGEEWSADAGDYIVKIGKYDGVVDTVTQSGGVTALKLVATPALSDYSAGNPINISVIGKLTGNDVDYVAAGSIQLAGA